MKKKDAMGRRRFLKTGVSAAAGAALAGGLAYPSRAAATSTAVFLSNDELFGFVEDMWRFGNADRYGYRMPGTKSDHQCAEYLLKKFQDFGLKNTKIEPIPEAVALPDKWTLTVHAGGKSDEMPCSFLRYAKFTDAEGVSAPMVYVGRGTDADFAKTDVKGKIVVADIVSDGMRVPLFRANKFEWPDSFFTYDPKGTLADDKNCENWPPSFGMSYGNAVNHGAVGFVGILELRIRNLRPF
jgi:hypothetical protein